jgi:hypothetical protein
MVQRISTNMCDAIYFTVERSVATKLPYVIKLGQKIAMLSINCDLSSVLSSSVYCKFFYVAANLSIVDGIH